jgi:hypothetical protein
MLDMCVLLVRNIDQGKCVCYLITCMQIWIFESLNSFFLQLCISLRFFFFWSILGELLILSISIYSIFFSNYIHFIHFCRYVYSIYYKSIVKFVYFFIISQLLWFCESWIFVVYWFFCLFMRVCCVDFIVGHVHGLLCPKAFFEEIFYKTKSGFNYNL